jgi:hypothetical protein
VFSNVWAEWNSSKKLIFEKQFERGPGDGNFGFGYNEVLKF